MYIDKNNKLFSIISDIITERNIDAYLIGGFVRDIILKRQTNDIDIVCLGSGIELAKAIAEKLNVKKVNYFKNFGTAMFVYNNLNIEFVGARKESYKRESRKPIVEDGTIVDDQNRRDFTINALAISLNKKNFGELIDPFKGLRDIEDKVIKTPLDPDITYSDDPLRMIRAIRFASQLDFTIHIDSLNAISRNKERIKIVSKERITDELNKIILSKTPSIGFKLLDDTGLLEIIFPELFNLKGVDTINGKSHKDNFLHSIQVLDNISTKTDNIWLRWAALLHDIGKPKTKKFIENIGWTFYSHDFVGAKMIEEIFKQLKFPQNQKMKYIQKIVSLHLRPIALVEEIVTDSAIRRLIFDAGDYIDDLMMLCEADITSKNNEKVQQYLKNFEIVRQKIKEVEEKDSLRNWQPPISGEIIINTFNITPGREVGIIKNAIKDAILDGIIENNYESAFNYMFIIAKSLGLKKK